MNWKYFLGAIVSLAAAYWFFIGVKTEKAFSEDEYFRNIPNRSFFRDLSGLIFAIILGIGLLVAAFNS